MKQASQVAQMVTNPLAMQETGFNPWVGKIPWRRAWQPTPVFWPGESPWTEEPGGLQSMSSKRVGHDWTTQHSTQHVPLKVSFTTGSSKPGSRPRPLVGTSLELFWPQPTTLEKDTALIVLQKGQPSGIVQLLLPFSSSICPYISQKPEVSSKVLIRFVKGFRLNYIIECYVYQKMH